MVPAYVEIRCVMHCGFKLCFQLIIILNILKPTSINLVIESEA